MQVREQTKDETAASSFEDVLSADLNPAQREAVSSFIGPMLILAGAGSGKTRTLTYRIAALLASRGARPDQIIALTFTNKASREMRERIERLVGKPSAMRLWMGTFHSLFARILRIEAERLGFTSGFSIFDQEDSVRLVRELLAQQRLPLQQNTPQQVQNIISSQKNSLILPDAFASRAQTQLERLAAILYPLYQHQLKKQNAMDFDDLLVNVVLLFQRQPDVLQKYQEKFQFIFVDEYQDTNHTQYLALRLIADAHHNICVVGDDAQSIYGWRGADIRNILQFERDYPDCRVVRLEQNYRSTKYILQAAQALIKQNHNQLEKELWTENPDGDKVAVIRCLDEVEEGAVVGLAIKEEIRKKKLSFRDCAVLYRTNAQSRAIEDALRNVQIPYSLVGGTAFYQRKEIKDVLAYLRVVMNPSDDESLLRIVNVPGRGIGETTIGHIRAFASSQGISVYDALLRIPEVPEIAARSAESVRTFRSMLQRYVSLKNALSASELARTIIDEAGFLRVLKEEATAESRDRRDNIMELLSAIALFCDESPDATIEDFLSQAVLTTSADNSKQNVNTVTIMTLHAAKGLEFPLVVICGCEEGLIPLGYSPDAKEIEEERRLFYVGMTRARQRLILLSASSRFTYGERIEKRESRFITNLNAGDAIEMLEPSAFGAIRAHQRVNGSIPSIAYNRVAQPTRKSQSETFEPGTAIMHDAFGPGRIIQIKGKGDDAHAIVDFRSVGRKHLMLKYANLKKL